MKTLFCIIGNLRGGELPFHSFRENFPDVDVALCVGNTYQDSEWRGIAKYIWEVDESNENIWYEIFDGVSKKWREFEHFPNLWGPYKGLRGSGMIIMSFRQRLYEALSSLEEQYDRYVLTRSDQVYTCAELPYVEPNKIYIPKGQEWGGVTDRLSVADQDSFLRSLLIIEFLQENYAKCSHLWSGPAINLESDVNLEKWLKEFYLQTGLEIVKIKRTNYTVARHDEQTRWRAPDEGIACPHRGYFLKYPKEYLLASIPKKSLSDVIWKLKVFVSVYFR